MRVAVSLEDVKKEVDTGKGDRPCYWKAENHVDETSNLRVENWLKPIRHLVLAHDDASLSSTIRITHDQGTAILRYIEEVKMFANIRDTKIKAQNNGQMPEGHPEEGWKDPLFLDHHWETEVLKNWPSSKNRSKWLKSLKELESELETAITKAKGNSETSAAFVKLSVRSPKDAVFNQKRYYEILEKRLSERKINSVDEKSLSIRVEAIRYASWKALKCYTAKQAMDLLLRSERIYVDILQHELFTKGDKDRKFNLNAHVAPFKETFDPSLEFRGFVAGGKRTAITAYSPFVYDEKIVKEKKKIWEKIDEIWTQAEAKLTLKDYSIDFCLSPDLKECRIIEINAFLPPLAGCGLFDYDNEKDRKLMLEGVGEFEFRIKSSPLTIDDFTKERTDHKTGKVTKMVMMPAPPHVMFLIDGIQKSKEGARPWGPSSALWENGSGTGGFNLEVIEKEQSTCAVC